MYSNSGEKSYTRVFLNTADAIFWDPTNGSCTFNLPKPVQATKVGLSFFGIDGGLLNVRELEQATYNGRPVTLPPGSYLSISNLLWSLTGYDASVSFSHVGNTLRIKAVGEAPVSLSISQNLAKIIGTETTILRPGVHTIQPTLFYNTPYISVETSLVSPTIVNSGFHRTLGMLPNSFKTPKDNYGLCT